MSSRRRLYLNLKQSITKLFKTPAHYLKELTGKQSIYEKPYLDRDYRQMHLNLPVPRWKRPKPKPGPWPPPGGSYWSKFIFGEGECSFYDQTGECGELITFNASIDQLLMGPYSLGTAYTWNATSSDQELAIIQPIEQHLFGASATIPIQLSEENSGTVTICVTAQIAEGSFIKEIVFPVPLPWWDPKYDWRWQNLKYMLANVFPSKETRLAAKRWNCGCVDLEVTCACEAPDVVWGAGSDETVARNGSANLELDDHNDCDYTWSVSGTGFTLDSATGISNTLNANGSACGAATITVTGEDATVVTGYVRCTTGHWGNEETLGGNCPACRAGSCSPGLITGKMLLDYATQCGYEIGQTTCICCNANCTSVGQEAKGQGNCGTAYCFDTSQKWYEWVC